MKRLAALLLVLCLILCGCGKSAEAPTEAPTEPSVEAPSAVPTEEPTEAPTEAPTEPPVLFRHPLTGEPLDSVFTTRPIASTANNVPSALPQHGISQADIVYEFEVEGAATRCLAIFTDLSALDALGSIRSARTYFNSVIASYDGILVHAGSSKYARQGQYDLAGEQGAQYDHIDMAAYAKYCYRDQDRRNNGYAYEHTLFSSGELLTTALEELNMVSSNEAGYDYGLTFSETPGLAGSSASTVTITFPGGKTTTMVQNDAGLYEASQYDQNWIDGETDENLSFRNLLILRAERSRPEGKNSFYTLVGSGTGYFVCDGQLVKILWTRESHNAPFAYTLENGTPLTLGVGKSYIAVINTECSEPLYN